MNYKGRCNSNLNKEEKQQLIELLQNYKQNYYDKIINPCQLIYFASDSIINKMKKESAAKKILIENTYGLLGNYLYKIKDNIKEDKEILDEIYKTDKEILLSKPIDWRIYSKLEGKILNDKEILINSLGSNDVNPI